MEENEPMEIQNSGGIAVKECLDTLNRVLSNKMQDIQTLKQFT